MAADVKWIKLSTDILDNKKIKKIRRLPSGDQILIVWIKLLTMAGKCNSKGYIFITENVPYEADDIAEDLGYDVNVIDLALGTFSKLGMIDLEDDGKIYIEDWESHQDLGKLEKIKEDNRKRVAKYREKAKCNVTVALPVTQCNATDKIRLDKIRLEEEKKKKEEEVYIKEDHLILTVKEKDNILKDFPRIDVDDYIDRILNYDKSDKYKSLNRTIRTWARKDLKQNGDYSKVKKIVESNRGIPQEPEFRIG